MVTRSMPEMPIRPTLSFKISCPLKIRNTGVKARNGNVRDKGEYLIAFMYRI